MVGFLAVSLALLFTVDSLLRRSATLSNQSALLFSLQMEHQRLESEQRHAEAMQTLYDRLRDVRHDVKNQMLALSGLAESGDLPGLRQHLAALSESSPQEALILTKFPQLDTILSAKLQQAQALEIPCDTLFVMPAKPPLAVVDLCSIMGNILDNALEALQQVPPRRRYLNLYAGPLSNMWQIRLENAASGLYRRDDKRELLSTKEDPWHGIGLRRVRQLVEQAEGSVFINAGVSVFVIDILLPWSAEDTDEERE